MERMEHFHDGKLFNGETLALEGVEGHLGYHVKAHGRKQWFGYFELANEQRVDSGARYRLMLRDGRTADINAADIPASDSHNRGRHVVEFYVMGEVRGGARRGMEPGPHRLA
jgi:hypothetical protein